MKEINPERVADVLELLCGKRPPIDYITRWLNDDETWIDDTKFIGPPLQDWLSCNSKLKWAFSITQIEAAISITEEPRPEEEI